MQNPIIISILAGAASVLLLAAGLTGNLLAFPFMALSPLPIAVAAFGWGSKTALFATLFSTLLIVFIANFEAAIVFAAIIGCPVLFLAHSASLSREDEHSGSMEWFPVSQVFVRAILIGTGIIAALLVISQFDVDLVSKQALKAFSKDFEELDAESRQIMEEALRFQIAITPYTMPMVWLPIMWGNLYLAHKIAQKSGQSHRPNLSLSEVELPFWVFALPSIGYLVTTLGAPLSHLGATAIGSFLVAFVILGFNCLHVITAKNALRPFLLSAIYVLVIIVGLPIFLVLGLGIADFFFKIRQRFLLAKSETS